MFVPSLLSNRTRELSGNPSDYLYTREIIATINVPSDGNISLPRILRTINVCSEHFYTHTDTFPNHLGSPIVIKLNGSVTPKKFNGLQDAIETMQARLLTRHPLSPVYLVRSGHNGHTITHNLNPSQFCTLDDIEPQERINVLRQFELASMIDASGVIYEAPESHIYTLPSGFFTKHFFRVGNIQSQNGVLDNLFFWLEPHLQRADCIVAESWTISTLAYHCARRLESKYNRKVPVGFLSGYYDEERILRDFKGNSFSFDLYSNLSAPVFITSAVLSGKSLQRIKEDIAFRYPQVARKISFLSLIKLSDAYQGKFLADLSKSRTVKYFGSEHSDGVEKVDDRLAAIQIDPVTYVPAYHAVLTASLFVSFAQKYRDFFQRYAGRGIFKVHRQFVSTRHRPDIHQAFYVDFAKMVETQTFKERTSKLVVERINWDSVGVIIAQDNKRNRALLDLMGVSLDDPKLCFVSNISSDLRSVTVIEKIRALDASHTVLIVEAVTSTGYTLGLYTDALRDFQQQKQYFVGLARPPLDDWQIRLKELGAGSGTFGEHSVICVEEVCLPNWGEEDCPWCIESRLLAKKSFVSIRNQDVNQFFADRAHFLQNQMRSGIDHEAFFNNKGQNYDDNFFLTRGSFFLDKDKVDGTPTEADLICAVSAAIQLWRLRHSVDVNGVVKLDVETLVGTTRYTDTCLRAAIWRCAKSSEIESRPASDSLECLSFGKIIFDALEGTRDSGLRQEYQFAFPKLVASNSFSLGLNELDRCLREGIATRV